MRHFLLASVIAVSFTACGQKATDNSFTIHGSVDGANGQTAYLVSGKDTLGSAVVNEGTFTIFGSVQPENTASFVAINQSLSCSLFLEPGNIAVNLNLHIAMGTPLNDANTELTTITKKLVEQYRTPGSNKDSIEVEYNKVFAETSAQHIGNAFGLAIVQSMSEDMTLAEIDSVMALCDLYKNDPQLQEMRKIKETEEKTSAGNQFVDIEGINALTGEQIKLSDIIAQGKPVVVDFWASWCGPCRREINEYLSVYEKKYRNKVNFVGIAVWEKQLSDTQQAMSELPISWPVIFTGEEGHAVTESYGIQGIPQIMVIDATGKIRGRNLRGEAISMMIDIVLQK